MKIPKIPKYNSNIFDSFVNILPRTIFIGSALFYVLYLVLFFGLVSINETYINYLHVAIQVAISMFLLIRFHPFRSHVLEPQDGPVIFSAAIFLLTSLGLSQYIYYTTKHHLQKYTKSVTSSEPNWVIPPPFSGPPLPQS
jgi:hypothetical protein